MKKIQGKNYLEVVAVVSDDNVITSDPISISELVANNRVKKYVDKGVVQLLSSFDIMRQNPDMVVLFYYCEETKDVINALDVCTEYLFDNQPVTPFELIKKARTICGTEEIFDTNTSAKLLRRMGHVIGRNPNPTNKITG
jgi:hypothetical protein